MMKMEGLIFAIDLGGTSTKLAILTNEGGFVHKWQIPTDTSEKGQNILPHIKEAFYHILIELDLNLEQFIGAGIGAPGPVMNEGVITKAVNLGWTNFPLKSQLENLLSIPVFVGNDANCAALGEMWKGAGDGLKELICITLGTGVGGGVITKGNIVEGIKGAAGEIGHMTVKLENGQMCNCGKTGCLETIVSANGILHVTKEKLKSCKTETKLRKIKDEELTAKDVFDLAAQADELALKIVDEVSFYLGYALGTLSTVINPEAIIIGGGVSNAGETLIKPVINYYQKFAFPASSSNTKILRATLGNDAGVIGAGWLVTNASSSINLFTR